MSLLVRTKSGIGKVVGELPGKYMVELLNQNYEPLITNGKPCKILASKVSVERIGFIDGEEDLGYFLPVDPSIMNLDSWMPQEINQ
jgi:hypothetical protein